MYLHLCIIDDEPKPVRLGVQYFMGYGAWSICAYLQLDNNNKFLQLKG